MNDAATWITGGAALLLGISQGGIALLLRAIRSEHQTEIEKLRTEIAKIPQTLNGTYQRTTVCVAHMDAVKDRLEHVERRVDEVA